MELTLRCTAEEAEVLGVHAEAQFEEARHAQGLPELRLAEKLLHVVVVFHVLEKGLQAKKNSVPCRGHRTPCEMHVNQLYHGPVYFVWYSVVSSQRTFLSCEPVGMKT